ncbi:PepSY domain-containing protein [Verrucomicrobiaceae bacterium 227]
MKPSAPRKRRHRSRQWHRWLGLLAALPLLWLAISGVLLNHAATFGLNDRMVTSGWILRHYNQLPAGDPVGVLVGDRVIAGWDGLLFLDSKQLPIQGELEGAAALKGQLVVATDEEIGIFDGSDELVLELDELSLPGVPVEGVSVQEDRLLVFSQSQWYRLSEDFFTFEEFSELVSSTPPAPLESALREELSEAIQTRRGMPLSRVILDAHSGSLFGWPGWVLTDLTAVSVVILTVLGLKLFPKRRS